MMNILRKFNFITFVALALAAPASLSMDGIAKHMLKLRFQLSPMSWLDKDKGELFEELNLRELCTDENEHAIVNTPNSDIGISFGRAYCYLDRLNTMCLDEVNTRFKRNNTRPKVADIGAGHGYMTWKLIAAGGNVNAVEKQKPEREKIQQKVQWAKKFLMPDEKLNDTCIIFPNALNYKSAFYQERFDVIWAGAFIHFLTPAQASEFVAKLYEVTNEDGVVFATVQGPVNEATTKYFSMGQKAGILFPGHLIEEMHIPTIFYLDHDNNLVYNIDFDGARYVPIRQAPPEAQPGQQFLGKYGHSDPNQKFFDVEKDQGLVKRATAIQHQFAHYFDTVTLRNLFEKAGFHVEDIFYFKSLHDRFDGSLEDFIAQFGPNMRVAIKARKKK